MNSPLVALIIEDHPEMGEWCEIVLGSVGFIPFVVESGERALSLVTGRVPDLVVLDLHLPDVPGVEVLRRIRADARLTGMPVIVTTACPQMAESLWEEADVVLIKSISSAVLKRKAVELAQR